jgi:soluble lytic murein transglycosylase-like protein
MKPIACAALCCLLPFVATADTLFSSKGSTDFSAKLRLLDTRAASQYAGSVKLRPELKAGPERRGQVGIPGFTGSYRGPWLATARNAAERHGVPEDVFLRLVQRESNWNPGAVSHKGAIGLAQLMPETARLLQVDPQNPQQNLDGGARYLAQQFRRFGNWRHALAAYNAGPGAVLKHGGIPPYAETTAYVAAILGG